jgi:hypothetical protein
MIYLGLVDITECSLQRLTGIPLLYVSLRASRSDLTQLLFSEGGACKHKQQ